MAKRNKGKSVLARRLKAYQAIEGQTGTKKPGSQNSHKSHSGGRRR